MERVDGRRQTFPNWSLKATSFCIEEEVGYFWSHKHKQNPQTLKVQKRHILLPKHKPNGRSSMCKRNAFHRFWVETLLKSNIFSHVMHQEGSETLLWRNTEHICSDFTPCMCRRNYFPCLLVGFSLAPMTTHWEKQQICDGLEATRVYLDDTWILEKKQRLLETLDWATSASWKLKKASIACKQ